MTMIFRTWLMLCPLAVLAGCASNPPVMTASLSEPAAAAVAAPAAGGYAMSADEMALDCKELTGRMQLRILEIRDYDERAKTSAASRTFQSGFAAIFGGTSAGNDPDVAHARDRARLEAYNQRLAVLNCKSYDLDDELQPKPVKTTPAPSKPAPNAAKP